MHKEWTEREELLLYALQHPPRNVCVKLPKGVSSLESIDLKLCPSPLPLYAEAEQAARHAKGVPVPTFEFDIANSGVFIGGRSSGVQRLGMAQAEDHSRKGNDAVGVPVKADTRQAASNPSQRLRYTDSKNSSNSPASTALSASAKRSPPPDGLNSADTPQPDAGKHTTSKPSTPPRNAAALPVHKGLLGHLASVFRGSGSTEDTTKVADLSSAPTASRKHESKPVAILKASGILSSLWKTQSSAVEDSTGVNAVAPATPSVKGEDASVVQHHREQVLIPLCGATDGTISSNVVAQLGLASDVVAKPSSSSTDSMIVATSFPRPPRIELCEVLDSAPLAPFFDTLFIFAYENLLLAAGLLLTRKRDRYAEELRRVYRHAFNLTDEQHSRAIANVTPPALKRNVADEDRAAKEERQRYLSEAHLDATTFRVLCDNSIDDDFVSRTETLLGIMEKYPDAPGDTHVPFAVRAMVFAACLVPLYQLNPSTLNPIYTEDDVKHCLAAVRESLGIPPPVEPFCLLHAQLLANDQSDGAELQAVFLKDVARAVSNLDTARIADSPLTPPVKYAYYVLQETFCLAAVPMPWLDSSFSGEMQRGVTAAFVETCLALPPCMLTAMLLVEDRPVLPFASSKEDILMAFMEVFVNSGVFRSLAEVANKVKDAQRLSAASLFQRLAGDLDAKQKAYCHMLTRGFPLATMLIVPGRLRIGAYLLLKQHWDSAFPNANREVPQDYKVALDAFLDYLLDGCGGEKRTCQSEPLCTLLMRVARDYLTPLDTLAACDEAAYMQSAQRLLAELSLQWADTLEQAKSPAEDVVHVLRAVFGAARAPPLGGDAALLQQARFRSWADIGTALMGKCLDRYPRVTEAIHRHHNNRMPTIAAEGERVHHACAEWRDNVSVLPSCVHRLHTLVRVWEAVKECHRKAHRQYEQVRRVTGAPAVMAEELVGKHQHDFHHALLQLCDSISVHILARDSISEIMMKFMRFDAKAHTSRQHGAGKGEDLPMPRLYPRVTMQRILEEVRRVCDDVYGHIHFEPAVRQLHYRLGHNFVALLFSIYTGTPDVFLSPADAPFLLADLDAVRTFFFEIKTDPPNGTSASNGDVGDFSLNAVPVLRVPGSELLDKLYSVVQYVMTKSSAELTAGGVGVPPLHSLPECSNDSPWCQYVVRRVLEHRKGAKGGMWGNYKARPPSK